MVFIAGCQGWQIQEVEQLPPPAAVPETSEPGQVEVRYYDNLDGAEIDTMTASAKFPDNPDEVGTLTSLEDPENRAEYYGSFVRGFIEPPATGEYRFYISGNDQAEFWLSTSESPDDADLLAMTPAWTYVNQFNKYSSQTSPYVVLESGKRYFFRVLQKEGFGSDHFAVAWEGPGISQQVIGSSYIYSYAEPAISSDQTSQEAYNLGYRVGYLDGTEGLTFTPAFPPRDQDQDGLYDNWEVANGLSPTDSTDASSDPDGDLLAAADEFLIGTSENTADSDGDGLPDGVEFVNELDPLDPRDAQDDKDNDGYSNLDEFVAGTGLNSSEDFPETREQLLAGFVGQYFIGTDFNELAILRRDKVIDFDWDRGSPAPEIPNDGFSIRWSGTFTAPHSGSSRNYTFTTRTNDGARLYLDGERVINDWRGAAERDISHTKSLTGGQTVNITMENFEGVGSAFARLTIEDSTNGKIVSLQDTVTSPDPDTPATEDTDSDGIPDSWELKYGLRAYVGDSGQIVNNTDTTNLEAYRSGLNPYTLEPVDGVEATNPSSPQEPQGITLSWSAPSTRTDGTSIALSEIDYYVIEYGQDSGNLERSQRVGGELTSYTFEDLMSGIWYFTIRVVDTAGLESTPSSEVSTEVN